jgi:hypothetical protein
MSLSVKCYPCALKADYRLVQERTCQATDTLTAEQSLLFAFWPFVVAHAIFDGLARETIYIPHSKDSFATGVTQSGILDNHKVVKDGFNKSPIQEFCNGQLASLLENISRDCVHKRKVPGRYAITKETMYSPDTLENDTYDVGVTFTMDDAAEMKDRFRIWIESDNARVDELSKKPLRKLALVLEQAQPTDFYVTFIYFNSWEKKGSEYSKRTREGIDFQRRWFQLLDRIRLPLSCAVIHCVPASDPIERSVGIANAGGNDVLTVV